MTTMLPEGIHSNQFYEVKRNAHAMSLLLSSYDLEILVKNSRMKIGRFSTSVLPHISVIADLDGVSGSVLTVGSFCEFSRASSILIGGDHHPNIFNVTLGVSPVIKMAMDSESRSLASAGDPRPIVLDDNVVISRHAFIIGGAHVGQRAVIGAGAVVVGDCQAFWSHGGVPAKPLRECLSKQNQELFVDANIANVAVHCLHKLPKLAKDLMDGRISLQDYKGALQFLPARPQIHLSASIDPNRDAFTYGPIVGFSVGGKMVTDQQKLAALNQYFGQIASNSETLKWCPDVFWALGLY